MIFETERVFPERQGKRFCPKIIHNGFTPYCPHPANRESPPAARWITKRAPYTFSPDQMQMPRVSKRRASGIRAIYTTFMRSIPPDCRSVPASGQPAAGWSSARFLSRGKMNFRERHLPPAYLDADRLFLHQRVGVSHQSRCGFPDCDRVQTGVLPVHGRPHSSSRCPPAVGQIPL